VYIFGSAKSIARCFLQNGNKPQSEDSIGTSSVVGNPTAQTNTQLDSDIPNNNTGERNSATPLQTEVETTKDTERKSVNATEPSKQVTDPNKVPRSKGIILPATIEEISPHSSLVSEAEHASHNSKDASKSKTVSPETPHNSQTLEQSSAHKPETQVWVVPEIVFFFTNHVISRKIHHICSSTVELVHKTSNSSASIFKSLNQDPQFLNLRLQLLNF
jgi:hypothetical protein